MSLSWQWPWAAAAGALAAAGVILLVVALSRRRHGGDDALRAFHLDDDLNTERASRLFRTWRALNRLAVLLLACALALACALVARPSSVDAGEEHSATRDIVLCLDVSGSTLPYDRQVIETYRDIVGNFQGERIGMSIFNSTSRTVFPLTDDYSLVTRQLDAAAKALKGVESQDDIDKMSDADYQRLSDWLEGTQNRKDTTSLIGDGLVSCAAMLPGFAYGTAGGDGSTRSRAASIVLATDNVVSGTPTYTLEQALELTSKARITVDGLFSGPRQSEGDATTTRMKELVESHDGVFLTQSDGTSVEALVRDIESRRRAQSETASKAAVTDDPAWWTATLLAVVLVWLALAWRLRR
ncbi:vWA domain-containing protein [Bifidobacterium saguinibicoloris]|uniref:vWA domain-containing protein n=1 Tax=Bifidobacterium saguinibicoloris TaxID=2834433 RepID=UPI001C5880EB|nr:VWA domain-containing protein [Bifidobacterium saguinibicoloris]MBW3080628.1 VWA domain-containing protein [Bifidobacterium saguinibicoloris]